MPVIITESGVLNVGDQEEIARFFVQAYADWQRDRRVIASTPLFWDPDVDNHWMFTLDDEGNVLTGSAAYRAMQALPRVAGSPDGAPPLSNTPSVTASAVRARPLPIFMPGPPTPAAGAEVNGETTP
jgi:hypothetical protein